MKAEGMGERALGLADYAALLAAISVALVSWACLADFEAIPPWKPWLSVAVAILFALGSLTRHSAWGIQLKQAAGLWLILAPWLLGFMHVRAAFWAHVAIGAALLAATLSTRLRRPATAM
jgi:hypothetical protein